jgi:IS5 family transposase
MRPRERRESGQNDMFRARLDQIVDMNHALAKLARTIDWGFLERTFGAVYEDVAGRPPLPTRLMGRARDPQAHARSFRRCAVRAKTHPPS